MQPALDVPRKAFSTRHLKFFVPIMLLHLACFIVIFVGVSPIAIGVFIKMNQMNNRSFPTIQPMAGKTEIRAFAIFQTHHIDIKITAFC